MGTHSRAWYYAGAVAGAGIGVVSLVKCVREREQERVRVEQEEEEDARRRLQEEEELNELLSPNASAAPQRPQLPISRLMEEASSIGSRTICSHLRRTSKAHEAPSSFRRVSSASSLDA
eukprot:TRINITY_DN2769_c0_g3_i1.p1 TRINITY_DN2769_c0_g3~~TRINITY_DN2769_c0_g3_i1.p1  ORF type:complete len:119 (+),score=17.27 TRINITY_DN2769_c0_g3_i1:91-447(+)